jgi:predicted Zn finger-like uncharacterized protein
MRIVCPTCTATYEVPTALLKPGQPVRCARCTKEWVPSEELEDDPPAAPQVLAADPAPVVVPAPMGQAERAPTPRPAASKLPGAPPTPRASMLRLAWVASFVVLGVLVWGAYSQRVAIMQGWPPSIRVYAALGLAGGK